MRVLVVLASANRRGAEIEGAELARQLTNVRTQAEVVALSPSAGPVALEVDVLGQRPLGRSTLRALRRRARVADVVVAYGSSALPACAIALLGTRVPFVYRSIGDPGRWSRGGLHQLRTAALFHRANRVVVLWPGAVDAVAGLYRVPRRRIDVIPNARDPERFRCPNPDERLAARRAFGIAANAKVVAFVGALSSEKRPLLAIEAAMLVDGAHLLIAGDGPLRAEVTRAASEFEGRAQVLGAVDDVLKVFHAADVLLNTSSTEGMPGSVIEAALCSVPIVATEVGALSSSAMAACLLPPSSGASEFAEALLSTLTQGVSFDIASKHTWDVVVGEWLTCLRGVANR